MKIQVEGIEEIEITDPKGLCNPPVQHGIPITQQPNPRPQIPTPFGPSINPIIPGIAPPPRTGDPAIWRTPNGTGSRWGVGGPMIALAGQQTDPDKWEKNWNSQMGQASPVEGQPAELTERSKRILRGEDPDGD